MPEVLSQSEIDALLSAVSSGDVKTSDTHSEIKVDWISYDFTSHEKIIRTRFAALEGIHDRFASFFRVTLSNMLKRSVSVNCINRDFVKFGDYLTNVLLPTSMNIMLMPQLRGHIIMVVSSKLTYAMVDAYYGGSERPYSKIGGREEFTSIENQLIGKVVNEAIGDLTKAWRTNYPLEIEYLRTESNPQFVGTIHASEVVAVIGFEVEFENLSGPLTFVVQLSALESIQNNLSVNLVSDVAMDGDKWRDHWVREIFIRISTCAPSLGALNVRSVRFVSSRRVTNFSCHRMPQVLWL